MGPSSVCFCFRPEVGVELGRWQSLSLGMSARAGTEEGRILEADVQRREGKRQKQLGGEKLRTDVDSL